MFSGHMVLRSMSSAFLEHEMSPSPSVDELTLGVSTALLHPMIELVEPAVYQQSFCSYQRKVYWSVSPLDELLDLHSQAACRPWAKGSFWTVSVVEAARLRMTVSMVARYVSADP